MPHTQKPSALTRAYHGNELILSLMDHLKRPEGEPELSYSSNASKRVWSGVSREIAHRLKMAVLNNSMGGISLIYRKTGIMIAEPTLVVDVGVIRKEIGRRKKDHPNSICRAVLVPIPEAEMLAFQVSTVSLVLSRGEDDAPRTTNSAAAASLHLPSDLSIAIPNEEAIIRLVSYFCLATRDLRTLASRAAAERNADAWMRLRGQASVYLWQMDTLTPVKKLLVGFGTGAEVLKHALTEPEAREKRIGKTGMSRDEVTYLIWCHSLEKNQPAPPMIKL